MKTDHSSLGYYTQWFYFRIQNTKKKVPYKFNIVNMIKPDSLYNHGMRPLMYSKKETEYKGSGWRRDGSDIMYY